MVMDTTMWLLYMYYKYLFIYKEYKDESGQQQALISISYIWWNKTTSSVPSD